MTSTHVPNATELWTLDKIVRVPPRAFITGLSQVFGGISGATSSRQPRQLGPLKEQQRRNSLVLVEDPEDSEAK